MTSVPTSADDATAVAEATPSFTAADVDKPFHYIFDIPFPHHTVPISIKTLHGSTVNDICRVTIAARPTSSAATRDLFFKSCRGVRRGEILMEAGGLELLRRAGLPVPPILLAGEKEGTAYLAEGFVESGKGTVPNWHTVRDEAAAGRALAALHRHRSADGRFGCRGTVASLNIGDVAVPPALSAAVQREMWGDDDAIADGRSRAAAEAYVSTFVWHHSWPELYLSHLVQPQVTRAEQRGLWPADRQRLFDVFAERFRAHFATRAALAAEEEEAEEEEEGEKGGEEDALSALISSPSSSTALMASGADVSPLPPPEAADASHTASSSASPLPSVTECSLLHGDMWGGNLLFDTAGMPVFIDPQPLYGDREMDIAMTQFFGGFGPEFYAAYEAAYPLDEEAEMRVPWYQLYYALMHLNWFGEAYGRAVEEALRSV